MARDPGSVWKPLPEAGAPDGYRKNKFIVHSTGTMASAAANWSYFARGDVVVESTFIVGWGPDDPTLQIMDSTDLADANGAANDEGISVEVVGDGTGPYNAWQLSELVRLGLWARREHPLILPQVIPSAAQGSAGCGWHVMFGAPGPWTTVRGKECPGGRRIQQLKDTVFPAIFAGTPIAQEDDMYDLNDRRVLTETKNVVDALLGLKLNEQIARLAAQVATSSADVDEQELASIIVTALLPAVQAAAEKPGGSLTREDVEEIVRGVFADAAS